MHIQADAHCNFYYNRLLTTIEYLEKIKARQAELCFKDFEEEAKSAEAKFETKMLISRSISKTIVEEISVLNPDIVVMGSKGLTGLKKILLGSVTTEVLKKSTVPVLVVK